MDAHYLYRSLIPSSPSSSSGDLACRAVCRGRFSRSDTDQIVICRGSFVELLDITGDGKLTRFMIQPAFAEVLTVASLTMRAQVESLISRSSSLIAQLPYFMTVWCQDEMQDLLVMTSRSSVSVLAFAVALGRFVPITHINGSGKSYVISFRKSSATVDLWKLGPNHISSQMTAMFAWKRRRVDKRSPWP